MPRSFPFSLGTSRVVVTDLGNPRKDFCGLEVRGLLAEAIQSCEVYVKHHEPDGAPAGPSEVVVTFSARIVLVMPDRDTGAPLELQFDERERQIASCIPSETDSHGRFLDIKQAFLRRCLRKVWEHEWAEALALDGIPLENPHP